MADPVGEWGGFIRNRHWIFRRCWRTIPIMTQDPTDRATRLSEQLRQSGHDAASADIAATLTRHHGNALVEALRETCQTLLTAVETLDPASYAAIEELRLDLDRRLNTGHTSG